MSQDRTNPRALNPRPQRPATREVSAFYAPAGRYVATGVKIDRAVYRTARNSRGGGHAGRNTARHGAIGAIAVGLSPAA